MSCYLGYSRVIAGIVRGTETAIICQGIIKRNVLRMFGLRKLRRIFFGAKMLRVSPFGNC